MYFVEETTAEYTEMRIVTPYIRRWEDNIKIYIREIECGGID
jgi:hypothetical protein